MAKVAAVKVKQPKCPPPPLLPTFSSLNRVQVARHVHHEVLRQGNYNPKPASYSFLIFMYSPHTPPKGQACVISSSHGALFEQRSNPRACSACRRYFHPRACAHTTNISAAADSSGSSADITTKILEAGPVLERYAPVSVTKLKPVVIATQPW